MEPSTAISLAKDVFKITEFVIRLAKRDTVEMHELVDAIVALSFQLTRAQDSLSVVRDCWVPFMKTDGAAGQAAARKAIEVGMNERVKELHDHIASLKELFEQAQLDSDDISRRDLIILRISSFAKERKIRPLDEGRHTLAYLVKRLDLGMKSVRDSYMRLRDSVTHSPIVFTERLDSVATYLEKGFYDAPFRLQFHPSSHLAADLLRLMASQSALAELEGTLTKCGQRWVACELAAPENAGVDMLERVEKSHRNLVSRLYEALEEWQTSFPDLTKPVEKEALVAKEKLIEWFVASCRRYLALTLAIGGRVSEGKSSLLNAILGKKILPTDSEFDRYFFLLGRGSRIAEVVETAVPCCIRHAPGQKTPTLELPYMTPYTHALEQLRKAGVEGFENAPAYSEEQQELLENLHTRKGKAIASKLFDSSYAIPSKVEGEESIRELVRRHSATGRSYINVFQLAILNFLTRFSIITEDEIDVGTPAQWPLLSVEFSGLMAFRKSAAKLRKISGHFQVSIKWPSFSSQSSSPSSVSFWIAPYVVELLDATWD